MAVHTGTRMSSMHRVNWRWLERGMYHHNIRKVELQD